MLCISAQGAAHQRESERTEETELGDQSKEVQTKY
uniref:Uncharacterized protein n=1 Tax=Anguilla anguilla TaxID=7936 RepID=A0A0E9SB65_ANGAN